MSYVTITKDDPSTSDQDYTLDVGLLNEVGEVGVWIAVGDVSLHICPWRDALGDVEISAYRNGSEMEPELDVMHVEAG